MLHRPPIAEILLALAAVCLVLAMALAARGDDCPPVGLVPLANVAIHDGDTLKADIVCPFGLTIRDKSIRAAGYDSWEINRTRQTVHVSDVELVRGRQAKDALQELI